MIDQIVQGGKFIDNCGIAGETRADGAWPAMSDALQLSADRWLILYSTRGFLGVDQGFRGSDNDRSIIYQVRRGSAAGPVVREGLLARYAEDWDPLSDGVSCLKQHCHTGAFGVPKGALVRGKRVPHENVFVASWYRSPRGRGTGPHDVPTVESERRLFERAFFTEWAQFRLNDAGDDIELLQPPRPLRQKGYETGDAFCSVSPRCPMNTWYVKAAPLNDDMSEWVKVPHFSRGIAAIRLAFNPAAGLYEWVQTGPLLAADQDSTEGGTQLTETSVLRCNGSWIVSARSAERASATIRGVAWLRTGDLFAAWPEPIYPGGPLSKSPCATFVCADGQVRVFTNDASVSPYRDDRNPLYAWDVDAQDGFKVSNPRVVFDAIEAGIPVRDQSWARVDMPNLFPHAGGREQLLTCRVRLRERKTPHTRLVDEEKRRTGMYLARITYDRECAPAWKFGGDRVEFDPAASQIDWYDPTVFAGAAPGRLAR